jgi:hypothetical protein
MDTECVYCLHDLDSHVSVNDTTICTSIYIDPVTSEITFCDCVRGCCLEERCPGRSATHCCCVCLGDGE